MSVMNSKSGWGWLSRGLHWIMALMILMLIVVGSYASYLLELGTTDGITQAFEIIQTHKSVGFTVFVLAVLRVIWRFVNPTPGLPDDMPGWQKAASHASHLALYFLIIAMPVSGWLMASASPLNDPGGYVYIPNMVFGLFEMPDPFTTGSEELTKTLHTVHWGLAMALLAVLAVHIGAALKHHFVDKDRILKRMVVGE